MMGEVGSRSLLVQSDFILIFALIMQVDNCKPLKTMLRLEYYALYLESITPKFLDLLHSH